MAMNILYEAYSSLYVNLTNQCSCACAFCIRNSTDSVGNVSSLWLDREPSTQEVIDEFSRFDMMEYKELVFCGFGEPTIRFDVLIEVARYAKAAFDIPIRINTNGQGNLINSRNIVPEMEGVIDSISISLNSPDPEAYLSITQSEFGVDALQGVLDFAREAKRYIPNVTMTTVDTTISHDDEKRCQEICDSLGVTYRIRAFG